MMRTTETIKTNKTILADGTGAAYAPSRSRAWAEIDLASLAHNVRYLQSLLPAHCALMPVVKANAYGHGAELVARELNAMGIRSFCVACVSEGVKLRQQNIVGEILVLGYTHPDQFPLLDQYALTQTVVDHAHALALSAYACSVSRRSLLSGQAQENHAIQGTPSRSHLPSGQAPENYAIQGTPSRSHLLSGQAQENPAIQGTQSRCHLPSGQAQENTDARRVSPLPVHIAVDTGMHRLGEPAEHVMQVREMLTLPGLQVTGMYTHLAAAGGTDPSSQNFTREQIDAFYQLTEQVLSSPCRSPKNPAALSSCVRLHLQASYGILHYPLPDVDCARPGIALYGLLSNAADTHAFADRLRPVLSLRARVASVHRLSPGESAGYDMAYTATHPAAIATVTLGYADGLPRNLSEGRGTILLHGQSAPIVGRICMDQLLADVTAIPGVKPGDIATLIGSDGEKSISAADLADACGTITNELLCCLGPRLERVPV